MCFIKEEHHLWLCAVASFRQCLEQFRKHPQKECCIHARFIDKTFAVQNIDQALSGAVYGKPVTDIKSRFSKEFCSAFSFQCNKRPHDSTDTCRSDISVIG